LTDVGGQGDDLDAVSAGQGGEVGGLDVGHGAQGGTAVQVQQLFDHRMTAIVDHDLVAVVEFRFDVTVPLGHFGQRAAQVELRNAPRNLSDAFEINRAWIS